MIQPRKGGTNPEEWTWMDAPAGSIFNYLRNTVITKKNSFFYSLYFRIPPSPPCKAQAQEVLGLFVLRNDLRSIVTAGNPCGTFSLLELAFSPPSRRLCLQTPYGLTCVRAKGNAVCNACRLGWEMNIIAKDVALQVAAMKPLYTNREDVPAEIVKSESEVFWTQYKNQGKPEAALPKIVSSRMDTWHKENCLTEQMFVKDDSKTVAAYVADAGKQAGVAGLKVGSFVRLELGQGVEKKSGDFAAEVAQQIAASSKN